MAWSPRARVRSPIICGSRSADASRSRTERCAGTSSAARGLFRSDELAPRAPRRHQGATRTDPLQSGPPAAARGRVSGAAAAVVKGPPLIGRSHLAAAWAVAEVLEVLRARAFDLVRDYPFGSRSAAVRAGAVRDDRHQLRRWRSPVSRRRPRPRGPCRTRVAPWRRGAKSLPPLSSMTSALPWGDEDLGAAARPLGVSPSAPPSITIGSLNASCASLMRTRSAPSSALTMIRSMRVRSTRKEGSSSKSTSTRVGRWGSSRRASVSAAEVPFTSRPAPCECAFGRPFRSRGIRHFGSGTVVGLPALPARPGDSRTSPLRTASMLRL